MNSGTRPGHQDRPDLIEQARMHDAFESQAGRGKLRTYLGIPPRVGKTHATLRRCGTDAAGDARASTP
jgi:K+-sensing histidine kinase KdpD